MPLNSQVFTITGGMDRTFASHVADRKTAQFLYNMRQSATHGVLETTPRFYTLETTTRGTYYNAGSQTEPASSSFKLICGNTSAGGDFGITQYIARSGVLAGFSSQMVVYMQTTVPSAENVHTGCLLVVNSVSGLALNLGSSLDVEIEVGGVTFKYRKNGGAYTTGVAIAPSVSIDGGNATLYFLASSGFTATDTFVWTRLDTPYTTFPGTVTSYYHYQNRTLFSANNRIMSTRVAGSTMYVISAGYRPVYGQQVSVFEDHMITLYTVSSGTTKTVTVYNSDVTDVDNFISTDTNEADTKLLWASTVASTTRIDGLCLFVVNSRLFVFLECAIFYTDYLGLPDVFSFKKLMDAPFQSALIRVTPYSVYIVVRDIIYNFDGAQLNIINFPVQVTLTQNWILSNISNVYYDPTRAEVLFVTASATYRVIVYSERFKEFYCRAMSFPTSAIDAFCPTPSGIVAGGVLKTYMEDLDGIQYPVFDESGVFAIPQVVTQAVVSSFEAVVELSGVHITAKAETALTSNYYGSTDVRYYANYYNLNQGVLGSITTGTEYATDAAPFASLPRVAIRNACIAVTIKGADNTKPVYLARLITIEPKVYGENKEEPSR